MGGAIDRMNRQDVHPGIEQRAMSQGKQDFVAAEPEWPFEQLHDEEHQHHVNHEGRGPIEKRGSGE